MTKLEKECFETFGEMRDATKNEQESINNFVKSISESTNFNFFSLETPVDKTYSNKTYMHPSCDNCQCNVKNGGNGMCNCILNNDIFY